MTSLGENSDLIELNLETSSMMFFRQTHQLRMIRSIFPIKDSSIKEAAEEEVESSEAIGAFEGDMSE